MSRFHALGSFAAAAILVACSGTDIKTGSDTYMDFSKYKTYAWSPSSWKHPTTSLESMIQSAVSRELAKKGLSQVEASKADVLISYYAVSKGGEAFGTAPGPWRWDGGNDAINVKEGSLTLEFLDPKTGKDVWQGTAANALDEHEIDPKRVAHAALDLVGEYPVG